MCQLVFCQGILQDTAVDQMFLHSKEIIHRDLSSNNILLSPLKSPLMAKISDFELAKVVKIDSKKSLIETPGSADFLLPNLFPEGGSSAVKQYFPKTSKVKGFTEAERQSYIDQCLGADQEVCSTMIDQSRVIKNISPDNMIYLQVFN